MNEKDTNSVQRFIRNIMWLVVMVPGFLFALLLARASDETFLATSINLVLIELPWIWIYWIVIYLLVNWFATLVAGMFFILPEWERAVVLRLGKFADVKGPGMFVILPFLYSVADTVEMKRFTHKVDMTTTLTKDNVPVDVIAAVDFQITDPQLVVLEVKNFVKTLTWIVTEALKSTIGACELSELLSDQLVITHKLHDQIDAKAMEIGLSAKAVRISDIIPPRRLIEELSIIAQAERGAKAKQIEADAEVAVAEKLAEAARLLQGVDGAMRLRELQALLVMAAEEGGNMVIVYPQGDPRGEMIAAATAGSQTK